jgi:hypothetical protein
MSTSNKHQVKGAPKGPASRKSSQDAKFGPRTSGNLGAGVGDGAGTKSRAGLPPETVAMASPKLEMPAGARQIEAKTLPVPGIDDKLIGVHEPWDLERDRKIRMGR